MSKISKKGNNSKIIKKFFFPKFHLEYFSHHPLSADTSFKFLSLILFEIWHLQNFISIFSKGRNFTRGDNFKKKNMCLLFFHEESIHEVSRRYLIPEYHRCRPVYIGSCACVVKIVVKCSFEYLSVVHHTCRHPMTINIM